MSIERKRKAEGTLAKEFKKSKSKTSLDIFLESFVDEAFNVIIEDIEFKDHELLEFKNTKKISELRLYRYIPKKNEFHIITVFFGDEDKVGNCGEFDLFELRLNLFQVTQRKSISSNSTKIFNDLINNWNYYFITKKNIQITDNTLHNDDCRLKSFSKIPPIYDEICNDIICAGCGAPADITFYMENK